METGDPSLADISTLPPVDGADEFLAIRGSSSCGHATARANLLDPIMTHQGGHVVGTAPVGSTGVCSEDEDDEDDALCAAMSAAAAALATL